MEVREEVRDGSLAVLPFQDLSPEGDQAYFGDGLAVDLINQLGNAPQLRVTGKTSACAVKGENITIPQIGEANQATGSGSLSSSSMPARTPSYGPRPTTVLWAISSISATRSPWRSTTG